MSDTVKGLIRAIQQSRKEIREYKEKMNEWRKSEKALSIKERVEQQANAKR